MLCVTGLERTSRELAERLLTTGMGSSVLHEIRLDALTSGVDEAFGLIRRHAPQMVVCCRSRRQGGLYDGDEAKRVALLERAARAGAAYVDVEGDSSEADITRIRQCAADRGTKVILSHHVFDKKTGSLTTMLTSLHERGCDVVKLAVTMDDAADLASLLLARKVLPVPTLLIGMGEAGLLSRTRYPLFGSPWTYVAADSGSVTAPGQPTLQEALAMGLPGSARTPFLALVGGPQIRHSAGPLVYNRLFRARRRPWAYVPVLTTRAPETFVLLRSLGAWGASVTMPHKSAALAFADRPDQAARATNAANTLRFVDGGSQATNTDVAGVAETLRPVLRARAQPTTEHALVLGAGGAARAAVVACRALELQVSVSARREDQAFHVTQNRHEVVPWDQRHLAPCNVLINATPVAGAAVCPWPRDEPLRKAIVFDLAIAGEVSLLLNRARLEGATCLSPDQMWLAQGARQITWLTSEHVTIDELKECQR